MLRSILLVVFLVMVCSCERSEVEPKSRERVGVSKAAILLGSSSALSGHAGFLGTQYMKGAKLFFDEVNRGGGVHGRKIEVISLDDQYNPVKTVANTQIPAFGFFTGAEQLRSPLSETIFHLRDSYFAEAEGSIRYFVDNLGLKDIGIFYQEDAFGMAVLKGIQIALRKRGLEPVVTDTYVRGSLDIDDAVERISREDVDVIMMVGTYSPLAKFIKLTHEQGVYPLFSTVSFVGSEAYARELMEIQKIEPMHFGKIVVTQVVPSPFSFQFQAAAYYRNLSRQYLPEEALNYVAFEGFLNAQVIVHALIKAGEELTRSTFMRELRNIRDHDLGIAKRISYENGDHVGLSGIYYSRLKPSGGFEIFELE